MKTAKELLENYLNNIQDADAIIENFAENAAIELPYLESLGKPWRWEGKQTLHGFIKNFPKAYRDLAFKNIKILIDTPEQVFAEYEVEAEFLKTGKIYKQLYMGRLVAEDGKIVLLREALNLAEVSKAMTI